VGPWLRREAQAHSRATDAHHTSAPAWPPAAPPQRWRRPGCRRPPPTAPTTRVCVPNSLIHTSVTRAPPHTQPSALHSVTRLALSAATLMQHRRPHPHLCAWACPACQPRHRHRHRHIHTQPHTHSPAGTCRMRSSMSASCRALSALATTCRGAAGGEGGRGREHGALPAAQPCVRHAQPAALAASCPCHPSARCSNPYYFTACPNGPTPRLPTSAWRCSSSAGSSAATATPCSWSARPSGVTAKCSSVTWGCEWSWRPGLAGAHELLRRRGVSCAPYTHKQTHTHPDCPSHHPSCLWQVVRVG
jgi:hypothetical protein